jgi:hypothetical protein
MIKRQYFVWVLDTYLRELVNQPGAVVVEELVAERFTSYALIHKVCVSRSACMCMCVCVYVCMCVCVCVYVCMGMCYMCMGMCYMCMGVCYRVL